MKEVAAEVPKKSIRLANALLLVNLFIGVSWGILIQISQQLPRKTLLIFGIFSIILCICFCHLVAYYLTKPLWNCFHLCRYDPICSEFQSAGSIWQFLSTLKIHSSSLKLYFRTEWSSPYNFFFVTLVL